MIIGNRYWYQYDYPLLVSDQKKKQGDMHIGILDIGIGFGEISRYFQ